MVDFTQSVQLSRTAAACSARIIREENEFADDRQGMRRKLTLLLPGSASVQTGDGFTYGGKSYVIVAARYCSDVKNEKHVWRIQAVC